MTFMSHCRIENDNLLVIITDKLFDDDISNFILNTHSYTFRLEICVFCTGSVICWSNYFKQHKLYVSL